MRTALHIACCCALVLTGVCAMRAERVHDKSSTLAISFDHFIGKDTLLLNTPMPTVTGNTVNIERFRYYVSNFSVSAGGKTTVLLPQYFLIDEADPSSKKIELTVPDTKIDSIHFLLGVDSLRNVSGVQTGALDPSRGMFWTWNSGYVMAKLEGSCEQVAAAGNRFTFHIGGYKNNMNTARMIHLATPSSQKISRLHIGVDINRWFQGTTLLDIKATPMCHSPGALAVRIADNYAHQFFINAVN